MAGGKKVNCNFMYLLKSNRNMGVEKLSPKYKKRLANQRLIYLWFLSLSTLEITFLFLSFFCSVLQQLLVEHLLCVKNYAVCVSTGGCGNPPAGNNGDMVSVLMEHSA